MTYILNIDTSTEVCSVAISKNGQGIYEKIETQGPSHAQLLGVFVDDAVKYLRQEGVKLDAVAISCGPGSYTGLRIGVSEAKGLCFGLDIPLIAVETLLIMAKSVLERREMEEIEMLCPMIDARRMEVYAAIFDKKLNPIRKTQADIVDHDSYLPYLEKGKVAFFGNGAAKCKEAINHPNAIFMEGIYPQATDMASLAQQLFESNKFVDTAYFEPFYLKEFIATTPKNKVF